MKASRVDLFLLILDVKVYTTEDLEAVRAKASAQQSADGSQLLHDRAVEESASHHILSTSLHRDTNILKSFLKIIYFKIYFILISKNSLIYIVTFGIVPTSP